MINPTDLTNLQKDLAAFKQTPVMMESEADDFVATVTELIQSHEELREQNDAMFAQAAKDAIEITELKKQLEPFKAEWEGMQRRQQSRFSFGMDEIGLYNFLKNAFTPERTQNETPNP